MPPPLHIATLADLPFELPSLDLGASPTASASRKDPDHSEASQAASSSASSSAPRPAHQAPVLREVPRLSARADSATAGEDSGPALSVEQHSHDESLSPFRRRVAQVYSSFSSSKQLSLLLLNTPYGMEFAQAAGLPEATGLGRVTPDVFDAFGAPVEHQPSAQPALSPPGDAGSTAVRVEPQAQVAASSTSSAATEPVAAQEPELTPVVTPQASAPIPAALPAAKKPLFAPVGGGWLVCDRYEICTVEDFDKKHGSMVHAGGVIPIDPALRRAGRTIHRSRKAAEKAAEKACQKDLERLRRELALLELTRSTLKPWEAV